MNKVAIVTGGSRGIGAATCLTLAQQGYAVCINYRSNESEAQKICDEIVRQGGQAMIIQADVAEQTQVDVLFQEAHRAFGEVTHLVNNAGILSTQTEFKNIPYERFERIFKTNVFGTFLCSQAFIHQNTLGGAIVNVSSASSRLGSAFEYVDYAASKGAVDTFTKGLSLELAAQNIRVNAVRPGFIDTDMHTDGGEPQRLERLAPQIPLKRGGTAQEVAHAIAWLLSEEASYITGSFIDIAGGR